MILLFNHARKSILDLYFFYSDWFSLFWLISFSFFLKCSRSLRLLASALLNLNCRVQFGHQMKHLPFFSISLSKGFAPSISLFASFSHFLTSLSISSAFLLACSTIFRLFFNFFLILSFNIRLIENYIL